MSSKSLNFANCRVLVVGDIMLDRYYFGDTQRISPEAPVPVVKVTKEDNKPGGAGNVALNIAALGAQAEIISVVGDDAAADILRKELEVLGVKTSFVVESSYGTTIKQRMLSQNQQLLRLDFEEQLPQGIKNKILLHYQKALKHADVVILSDYAKGVLTNSASELIALAKEQNIPVLVDPKHDDFSLYAQATLITPNFKEFEEVVGKCNTEQEIVEHAQHLIIEHGLQGLLVTRGAQGMVLFERDEPEYYLPARGREVFDVTGAGDTVISVIALALVSGHGLLRAVELGNIAAGIVIGKLGAATVTVEELVHAEHGHSSRSAGVVSENALMLCVNEARAQGKKIVFTNGCFDVLHAMHVEYLELAAQQGDCLIVAVNDDASITRLKGEGRPVNQAKHRMAVLAGLQSVDWVVEFSDDTPCRLLELIKPDVLAKGGDYGLEGVVGADIVEDNGGKVVVLGGVADGVKSTAIIERMKKLEANK